MQNLLRRDMATECDNSKSFLYLLCIWLDSLYNANHSDKLINDKIIYNAFIKLCSPLDQRATSGLHNSTFIHSFVYHLEKRKTLKVRTCSYIPNIHIMFNDPLSTAYSSPLKVSMVTGSRCRIAARNT